MPYIGIRVTHGTHRITVKFHGPLDTIPFNTVTLKEKVNAWLKDNVREGANLPQVVKDLSNELNYVYCDGHELLWVDVELLGSNDLIFGSTAEKILVEQ